MPLFERARVEVYLPDLPSPAYQELTDRLIREFTYGFGGCTLLHDLAGSYLSQLGLPVDDSMNLLYTDTPFTFNDGFDILSRYTDAIRNTAFVALEEESILIAVYRVFHSV